MQLPGHEKKSIRVVLDTNALISAYLFRQRLGTIARLIQEDYIVPCFVVSTFAELETVMKYPKFIKTFRRNQTTPEHILAKIANKSIILPDPQEIPNFPLGLFDNYVLASAAVNNADYLVTGDKGLLGLKTFENIPIVSPQQFLKTFK